MRNVNESIKLALAGQPTLSEPKTGSTFVVSDSAHGWVGAQEDNHMVDLTLKRGRRSKKGRKHGRKKHRKM